MKNNMFPLMAIIFLAVGVLACQEEEDARGLAAPDSTPPGIVSEIAVTNLPGGAKIEYKLPDDQDALLVEASYRLGNGETVTAKSSIFKNFVTIEGLRQAESQEVSLVVVDRSNHRSPPVVVSISPETAPIDKLFTTFELEADFGGVRLKYNNEDEIRAELLLYASDESGRLVYSQSEFINSDNQSKHTFRGFPPETATFGIAAIDRWDNATEIMEAELLPLEEALLDIYDFKDISLDGDEPDAFGWVKTNMWDGAIEEGEGPGFHTEPGKPGAIIPPYTEGYHMFTVDLGVTAKLSRFKFWQRVPRVIFYHGNPRRFELWGIDEIPADNGASFDGWTRLVENGEVIKPSGGPINVNSPEDEAQAAAGEEYEFPIEAPPVRYIRFVNFENWSTSKFIHIMELNFWGQPAE